MLGGSKPRDFIEEIYLMTGKDFEITLDRFLTGNVPQQTELKLVKIEEDKKEEDKIETIDTTVPASVQEKHN